MKTIDEIQSELRALALELEQLKQSNDAAENLTVDFKKLSANGYRYPITPHPLESFDEHANKCYLTVLLTVAQFEPEMLSESLLLAHRIAFGMNYLGEGGDLQEEFAAAQTLTFSQLDEITSLFRETDERLMLILECMLTAGAFDKGRLEAFKYIAELAVLLNVDKEQLVFLSNMAAVILTGDLGKYKCEIYNNYGKLFECYLKDFDLQKQVIYINRFPSPFSSGSFFEQNVTIQSKNRSKIVCVHKFIDSIVFRNEKVMENTIDVQMKSKSRYVVLDSNLTFRGHDDNDNTRPIGVVYHYLSGSKKDILDFFVDNGGVIYSSGLFKSSIGVKYSGDKVECDGNTFYLRDDVKDSGLI